MPVLVDMEASLLTARTRSISAAAREIGTKIFLRPTWRLALMAESERPRPQRQPAISECDSPIAGRFISQRRRGTGAR